MSFILVDDGEISYTNPLGVQKCSELQALLRARDCFIPSFVGADPYSIETYICQRALYRTEITFVLDRNIYSQVLGLAKGKAVTESTKVAAAVMAFASCASVDVEPSLAIYEGSQSGARGGWRRDLALFRGASEISPINWASLALGVFDRYTKRLPREPLDEVNAKKVNPKRQLRAFRFIYPTMLKMANLCRSNLSRPEKMIALIDWMYHEWQFSSAALCQAAYLWSTNAPKGIFKGVGGRDRIAALKGVRDATWDLVYVTEWNQALQKQSNRQFLTVLCTLDVALADVARLILEQSFRDALDLDELFSRFSMGPDVVAVYSRCMGSLKSEVRKLVRNPTNLEAYRLELIRHLEAEYSYCAP